jgi:hypothetical protein
MTALRALLRSGSRLAWVLVVLALAARMLVPVGTMPTGGDRELSVRICAESGGPRSVLLTIPGEPAPHEGSAAKSACAFAGLSAPGLAAAEPVLLALALIFILALGPVLAPVAAPARFARFQPPLRGPPVRA